MGRDDLQGAWGQSPIFNTPVLLGLISLKVYCGSGISKVYTLLLKVFILYCNNEFCTDILEFLILGYTIKQFNKNYICSFENLSTVRTDHESAGRIVKSSKSKGQHEELCKIWGHPPSTPSPSLTHLRGQSTPIFFFTLTRRLSPLYLN